MKALENKHTAGGQVNAAGVVAIIAVAVSIGIACVGVAGIIGWSTPLTIAGSVGLLLVIISSEVRSATVLLDAERHMHASPLKAAVAILTFAVLELVNVTAGHSGLAAIDADAIAARRAPFEKALARSSADAETARAALKAFDVQTAAQAALWSRSIELVDGRFVTAGTKRLEAAQNAAAERDELRKPYAADVAKKDRQEKADKAALDAVPGGFPAGALWGFAGVLVLLKGVSVWLSTGARKRKGVAEIAPREVADMTDEELAEAASKAASISAQCRHERNRRTKAAA